MPYTVLDLKGLNDRDRSAIVGEEHMRKVESRLLKQWISRLAGSALKTLQYSGHRQNTRQTLVDNQPLIEELDARQLYSVDNALAFVIQNDAGLDTAGEYATLTPASHSATQDTLQTEPSHELVFIDKQVSGYEAIVSDLAAQQDKDRQLEVYFLDSQKDGILQISQILAPLNDIDAIHIISHGQAGEIQLGNQSLNSESIAGYRDPLSGWSDALAADADLLIYGCDVAGNLAGQTLLQTISALTETDIAASTDLTGHASLNADWDLEYQTGELESSIIVSKRVQAQFVGSLQIFTVDTTVDTTNSTDGVTSLREAIISANSTANLNSTPDEIHFNIPGNNPANHIIQLSSALPTISDAVIIDGTTDPDDAATNSPIIEIRGDATNTEFNGFTINGSGSGTTLKGMMISNTGDAIVLTNGGNNTIQGIHFGQTHSGSGARNIGSGIVINNSSTNIIGGSNPGDRNIISNNGSDGIEITGTNSFNNRIEGNYIGTDASGTLNFGNTFNGIHISNGAHDNIIGGLSPAAGNVISGNGKGFFGGLSGDGIEISDATSSNNIIQNNSIGLASDSTTLLGNARKGVWVEDAPDTRITGNVIAGNGSAGVGIAGTNATSTGIENNTIHHNDSHGIGTGTRSDNVSTVGQPSGITIRTNTLYANAGDEINLSASSSLQLPPTLTRATLTGTDLQIAGSMSGSGTYEIDFYAGSNPDAERYLGSATLMPGNLVINQSFTGTTVTAGEYIIATATDSDGNTSEFSRNIQVSTISTTDDSINTAINSPGTINVISNDSDSSGKSLVLLDVNKPDHGSVLIGQNGSLTYTPDTNYIGSDSFSYVVSNGTDSLDHYWGLSGNAQDALGAGNGVLTNTETIDGRYGQAMSFPNSASSGDVSEKSYVTIPNADIQYSDEFSLSLDFKLDDNSGDNYQYLFSHGNFGAANSINVYLGEDGNPTENLRNRLHIRINDNPNVLVNIGSDGLNLIGDNSWHTLTVTVNADSIKTFIDGDLKATKTSSGAATNPTGDLIVGGRNDLDTSRFYSGGIDALKVYSRALSDGEVAALAETPFSIQGQVNVTVSDGNLPPTLTANALNPTLSEGDNFKSIFNSVSVDAIESGQTFTELVFTISNVTDLTTDTPAERIMLDNTFISIENGSGTTNDNNFDYSINLNSTTTATITVTKNSASASEVQNLIESIQYKNVSNNPSTADRVFTITQLTDSGGTANGGNDTAALTVSSTASVVAVNDPPVFVSIRSDKPVFNQGGAPILLDENILIGDFELNPLNSGNGNYSGVTLTLSRNGGVNIDDVFTINGQTQAAIDNPVTSQEFANFNNNTSGELKINFGGSEIPTRNGVNAVLQLISYSNTNSSSTGDIQLDYVLNDGNSNSQGSGGAQTATGSVTVNIIANAPPSITNNTLTLDQGETVTLNNPMLLVSDPDSSPDNIIIIPVNVTQGYFSRSTNPGLAVASFTQSAVTSGNVIFVHDGGELAPSYDLNLKDGFNNIGPVAATIHFNVLPVATNLAQTISYTEDATSVAIEDIVVTDVDNSETITATLTLTDPTYGALTTSGTATYDTGSGDWTITDSVANVNTALASVAFVPSSNNDNSTTITTHIEDAAGTGPTDGSIILRVTAVNDAPVFTNLGASLVYINGGSAIDLDTDVTISDVELDALNSGLGDYTGTILTLSRNGGSNSNDILLAASSGTDTITVIGSVVAGFTSTNGQLQITFENNGVIPTTAIVNSILRDLTYENTNTTNPPSTVQINYELNDGNTSSQGTGGVQLATGSVTVNIDSTNHQPAASNLNQTISYTEGDVSAALDDIVIDDVDTDEMITASLAVANPEFGTLTLSGAATYTTGTWTITDTASNVNAALASVAFIPVTENDQDTTIAIHIVDGGEDGTTAVTGTINLNVTAVNDQPIITVDATNKLYLNNSGAITIDPALTISDIDSPDLSSAVVKFGKGYLEGEDVLQFTSQSGITGSFSANTGTLTLNGTASVADYETALRSVQYKDVNSTPTHGLLTINFSVNDGLENSQIDRRRIELIDDESPRTSNDSGTVLEGGAITINLSDNDSPSDSPIDFTSIIILDAPTNGNVDVNSDGTVTYTHDGSETSSDSFTYTIDDSDPSTSNIAAVTITVTPVNDAPVLTANPLNPGYTENAAAATVFDSVTIDTVESSQGIDELIFTVSNVSQLDFENIELDGSEFALTDGTNGATSSNGYGFSVSVAGSTATVTLTTNVATPTVMSSLIESIAYRNSSENPATADRVFTLTSIKDSGGTLNGGADRTAISSSSTVSVVATNDAPTASNLTQTIAYTEDDTLVAIDDIVVSDVDIGEVITATLTLANPTYGVLTTAGGGSYTAGMGIWTITDTVANVNAALAAVAFESTADNDLNTSITTHIVDADGAGPTDGSIALNVTPVNDTPITTGIADIEVNEDAPSTVIDLSSAFTDVEDGNNLIYSITRNDNAALFNTVITDSTSRTITLDYATDTYSSANITVRATDSGSSYVETTFSVTINPINDIPTKITLSSSVLLNGTDTTGGYAVGLLSTNDPDVGDISTFAVIGGNDASIFSIGGTNNNELVISSNRLDSDVQSVYSIIVESTDAFGDKFSQTIEVTVTDDTILDQLIIDSGPGTTTGNPGISSTTEGNAEPVTADTTTSGIEIELTDPNEPPAGGSHSSQPPVTEETPKPESPAEEMAPEEEIVQHELLTSENYDEVEDEKLSAMMAEYNEESTTSAIIQGVVEADKNNAMNFDNTGDVVRSNQELESYASGNRNLNIDPENLKSSLSQLQKVVDINQFIESMDQLRDESEDQSRLEERVIGTSTLVTSGLSVGYIIWLVRGGVLLSSVLSSLPAWRFIDPLPILGSKKYGDDEDDESLESIIESESEKVKQKNMADEKSADSEQKNTTMDSKQ